MPRTFYINLYPDGVSESDGPEAYAYADSRPTVATGGIIIEVTIPDPEPVATVRVVV